MDLFTRDKINDVESETYTPLAERCRPTSLEDFIGNAFFFRTVTYHIIGKVVKVLSHGLLELEQATWVADSGRFMECIKNGELNETEPTGQH